jgi:hypothetical protein
MKWYHYLRPRNWGIVKVYRDFENFADWRRKIRNEEDNPQSKYNRWKIQRTRLYDLYVTVSLDEADAPLPENVKRTKVVETLNPLNRYLDEEMGFAECLSCEFNQFEDDDHNLTLTYLIVYRFIFNKFSIKWLIKNVVFWTVFLFVIFKFHVIQWLLHLI